jgi:hypothetical protein
MAQSQCIRIPLRKERATEFLAWLSSLRGREDELKRLLADEGMLAELVFVERRGHESALVLYTRASDLAAANAAYLASQHPIDVEMRAWQACAFDLAGATVLEIALEHGQPDDKRSY